MNPTEKENRKKIMTPSTKNNFPLNLGLNRAQNNAGVGSKLPKQSYTVSKYQINKTKPKENQPFTESNENTGKNDKNDKNENRSETVTIMTEMRNNSAQMQNVILKDNTIPFVAKTKRKFTEIQKEKEDARKASQPILEEFHKINKALETNKNEEEFFFKFDETLEKFKVIDPSQLIPIPLNDIGSCLLENSKFFVSFIKFKETSESLASGIPFKLPLERFVSLVDCSLNYDQNDLKLIFSFFVNQVRSNYSHEEILRLIEKRHPEEIQQILVHSSDINESHYKYLLYKPRDFNIFEQEILNLNTMGEDSKRKKITISSAFNSKKTINIINLKKNNINETNDMSLHKEKNLLKNFESAKKHDISIFTNSKRKTFGKEEGGNSVFNNLQSEKKILTFSNKREDKDILNFDEMKLKDNEINSDEKEKILKHSDHEGNAQRLTVEHSSNNFIPEKKYEKESTFQYMTSGIPVIDDEFRAQDYYSNLIDRNRKELIIENNHFTFRKVTPKKPESFDKKPKSPFALIDNTRFSIVKPETTNDEVKEEQPRHSTRGRSNRNISKTHLKKEIEAEVEVEVEAEEQADEPIKIEDIVEEKEKYSRRSLNKKKRYQSDKKEVKIEEEEEEEVLKKDKKKNKRKTKSKIEKIEKKIEESESEEDPRQKSRTNKNKKKQSSSYTNSDDDNEVKRGRSSRKVKDKRNKKKNSQSPSAKESEDEKIKPLNRRLSKRDNTGKIKSRNERSRKKGK
jgi:hypothetical protein